MQKRDDYLKTWTSEQYQDYKIRLVSVKAEVHHSADSPTLTNAASMQSVFGEPSISSKQPSYHRCQKNFNGKSKTIQTPIIQDDQFEIVHLNPPMEIEPKPKSKPWFKKAINLFNNKKNN